MLNVFQCVFNYFIVCNWGHRVPAILFVGIVFGVLPCCCGCDILNVLIHNSVLLPSHLVVG